MTGSPGDHHQVTEQAEHAAERVGKGKFGAAVAAEFDLQKAIGGLEGSLSRYFRTRSSPSPTPSPRISAPPFIQLWRLWPSY